MLSPIVYAGDVPFHDLHRSVGASLRICSYRPLKFRRMAAICSSMKPAAAMNLFEKT